MIIGIYSGSFDPIHTGHAMLANYVAQSGVVDRVWLMVSRHNPLKDNDTLASEADRLAMASLVAARCKNVEVSDFEMHLPSPSYTIDTLDALSAAYPCHTFKIIIGSDNWLAFNLWKDHKRILSDYGVIIYPRPGANIAGPIPSGAEYLEKAPIAEISSTAIRKGLAEGRNECFMIPESIASYIEEHSLYNSKLSAYNNGTCL